MYTIYSLDWGYSLVSRLGKTILPFSKKVEIGHAAEGLVLLREKSQISLSDEAGRITLLKNMAMPFACLPRFSDGLVIMADKAENYGYVDHRGNWAIPPQYDVALDFRSGFAVVGMGGNAGLIDKSGKLLAKLDAIYLSSMLNWPDDVGCFDAHHYVRKDFAVPCVVKDFKNVIDFPDVRQLNEPFRGIVGVELSEDNWALQTVEKRGVGKNRFKTLCPFACGLAVAKDFSGKYGAVDCQGNWVILPKYLRLDTFREGFSLAQSEEGWVVINRVGEACFSGLGENISIGTDHIQVFTSEATLVLEFSGKKRWSFRK